MTFQAYIFPASVESKARIELDEWNRSVPLPIYSGPHQGKMFLDQMNLRDPRWIALFHPLFIDPANDAHLVDLDEADIRKPGIELR